MSVSQLLLFFLFLVKKKERAFTKPSQIYLWLSQKLSHWMAELQENPRTVIQSSSISSKTLFTDTTREGARNHTQCWKWEYLVQGREAVLSHSKAVFPEEDTHLWVQDSKVAHTSESALSGPYSFWTVLQTPWIGFLCQTRFFFVLYDCSVLVNTLRTSRPPTTSFLWDQTPKLTPS